MKRALLILCSLLMIVSFVFVGCKGAVNSENPDDTEQSGGGTNNPSGSGGDDGGSQIVPSGSTVVDVLLSKASGFSENDAKFIEKQDTQLAKKLPLPPMQLGLHLIQVLQL